MEFAVSDQRNSDARPTEHVRNASVSTRIIASNPTRKKDPIRAMYSALQFMSVCVRFMWDSVGQSYSQLCKVQGHLHVQTTKKWDRRHIFELLYKSAVCTVYGWERTVKKKLGRSLCKQI